MRNARPRQSLLPLERKHQRRVLPRSAAEIDFQRETTLIVFDIGQSDFGEVKSGVPHQRTVGVDPEVVAAFVIAEQCEP
jgi:hypothetical protein